VPAPVPAPVPPPPGPPAQSAVDEARAAQQGRVSQLSAATAAVSVPAAAPNSPSLASITGILSRRVCALFDRRLISEQEEETVLDHVSDWLELSNVSLQARQRLEALAELSEAMPIDRAFARQVLRRVAN
jgi:hypothetical protein